MRLPKLGRILSAEGELQPLLAKTRELRTLAGLVGDFLSADLAREARVANYKDGELVLIAAHSPAAAKLRLLAPALGRYLSERQWQVSSVSVRVQPNRVRNALPEKQKTVHLSTHALESLRTLHDKLGASPAREALARMLRRHKALPVSPEVPPGQGTAAKSPRPRKARS